MSYIKLVMILNFLKSKRVFIYSLLEKHEENLLHYKGFKGETVSLVRTLTKLSV